MLLADDGQAPPLYLRGPGYAWGPLHATETLGPEAAVRRWKVLLLEAAPLMRCPRRPAHCLRASAAALRVCCLAQCFLRLPVLPSCCGLATEPPCSTPSARALPYGGSVI